MFCTLTVENKLHLSSVVLGSGLWGVRDDMSPSLQFTLLREEPFQVQSLDYVGTVQRASVYFRNMIAISSCAEAILFYASFAVVNRSRIPPA